MSLSDRAIRNLVTAWNSGNVDEIAAVYAPDAVLDHVLFPQPLTGRNAIRDAESGMFAAFSDIDWTVAHSVASGDEVAVEWVVKATHTAPMPTPGGPLPATGKRIVVRGSSHFQVRPDGTIGVERRYLDGAGMFAQLTG
jgi:steroid delta-isomerase-like uncharacterized protein